MADVRVKTQGTTLDGSIIENAATEQTLDSILDQLKILNQKQVDFSKKTIDQSKKDKQDQDDRFNKHFGKSALADQLKKAIGGSATGSAGMAELGPIIDDVIGGLEMMAPEIIEVTLAVKAFAFALTFFSNATHAAMGLTKAFIEGKTSLSVYTGMVASVLDKIPILGTLADVAQTFITEVESWNNTLYETSKVGATFNESLMELRGMASQTGLTLQQYSKIIIDNASKLASYGTVMDGVKKMTNVSSIALNQYSHQLNSMGITMEQFNEDLPGMLDLLSSGTIVRHTSDQQLTTSAIALSKEFTLMAEMTGKSRQSQEELAAQQQADSTWQIYLSGKSKAQQEELTQVMSRLSNAVGPTAGEMTKFLAQGIIPWGDKFNAFRTMIPGATDSIQGLIAGINNGTFTMDQLDRVTSKMVAGGTNWVSANHTAVAAGQLAGGTFSDIAQQSLQMIQANKALLDNGKISADEYYRRTKGIETQMELQSQQSEAYKDALDSFHNFVMRGQQGIFMNVVMPFMKQFQGQVSGITTWFDKHPIPVDKLGQAAKWLADEFIGILNWVETHLTLKSVEADLDSFVKNLPMWLGDLKTLFNFIHDIAYDLQKIGKWNDDQHNQIHKFDDATWNAGKAIGNFFNNAALQQGLASIGHSGGTIASGPVIQNFGVGTPTVLHGREAVLTEGQLTNLVKNVHDSGAADALKSIADILKVTAEQNQMIIRKLDELNDWTEKLLRSNKDVARYVR